MSDEQLLPWDPEWLVRRGNYLTLITPEVANGLLERNTNNRRPKTRKIEQYAREMKAGRWDPDASDIKLARTGELIDGQNRLMACVEANVPFPTMVRTCLGLGSKSKVDTGTARTAADALKMAGIHGGSPTAMAAAVALRVRYMERVEMFDRRRGWDYRSTVLTHDEVIDFLAAHPMIEKFGGRAQHLHVQVIPAFAPSVVSAALSWFAEADEVDAAVFYERLISGEWGGPGDPLMSLVGYAARLRGNRKQGSPGGRGRVAQEEGLMALVKVWNAFRSGEDIKLLSIRREERLEVPQ